MDRMAVLEALMKSYLHFCRAEKNLSSNSVEAYRRDLGRLGTHLGRRNIDVISLSDLRAYVDSLSADGLSKRSIARHVTTIRGFFQFVTEQVPLTANPAELLASPAIGESLP